MPPSDDPLLDDYLEEWLRRRRTQLRPGTFVGYRGTIRNHIRPRFGCLRLSELDPRGVEQTYAELLVAGALNGGPLSPRSVQLIHAILHRALEDARLDGLLDRNPLKHVSPPRRHAGAVELNDGPQVWTFAESARFLASLEAHRHRALWHLALSTGARQGELAGLRWQDVNLDSREVRIRRSLSVADGIPRLLRTKSSRSRRLAIGPCVTAALRCHRQQQQAERATAGGECDVRWDLVFTGPSGDHVNPGTISHQHRSLVRATDVPVIRFHDLRHTHASLLMQLGVPIKTISARLGHASVITTMDTYAHLLPAMDRDAADTFAKILSEHAELL